MQHSLAVMPMEKLELPAHLSGLEGSNRGTGFNKQQIAANNDYQAIQTWLGEFSQSPQTLRTYRKEVERVLLWSILQLQKPLSSLTREDFAQYQAFLADPQPAAIWCGPAKRRFSQGWRPFTGPLSPVSQRQALVIINALFSYLVEAGYLAGNPLSLMRQRNKIAPANRIMGIERFLEQDIWQHLDNYIENLPRETDKQQAVYQRTRFLFTFLYLMGPRVSEVANGYMGDFLERNNRWWWYVLGKGNKAAYVPVNDKMLQALINYRRFYQLPPLPSAKERPKGEGKLMVSGAAQTANTAEQQDWPIVMSLYNKTRISSKQIYRIVKHTCAAAADSYPLEQAHKAEKLRQASTHWLRHTAISHQAESGIGIKYLQQNARHSDLNTTARYMHVEDEKWHEEMAKHG
jgi:site-specific recombinase XerD